MWTKPQTQTEAPAAPPAPASLSNVTPLNSPSSSLTNPAASSSARIGSTLQIKGQIIGTEDLQIDGKVDGPISLKGQLTVGATAELNSEVRAGSVVVYGRVGGNLHARERVDIKCDGSVSGDIATSRISIEDGAHFKGRIEIDPAKAHAAD